MKIVMREALLLCMKQSQLESWSECVKAEACASSRIWNDEED